MVDVLNEDDAPPARGGEADGCAVPVDDNDDDNNNKVVMVNGCNNEDHEGGSSLPSSSTPPDAFSGVDVVAAIDDAQIVIARPSPPAEGGAGVDEAGRDDYSGYDKVRNMHNFIAMELDLDTAVGMTMAMTDPTGGGGG